MADIIIDGDPKPLAYWAEKWATPATTIKGWIQKRQCPGTKIGGQWMISAVQLLEWNQPEVDNGEGQPRENQASERRRPVRETKVRPKGPARKNDKPGADRWAV